MIAARPNRPSARNTYAFTLPELVVTILIAAVLIGSYIGAMDHNETMRQALQPSWRLGSTPQQTSGVGGGYAKPEAQVAIAPDSLQAAPSVVAETLGASRATDADGTTVPQAPVDESVTDGAGPEKRTAPTEEAVAAQPPG